MRPPLAAVPGVILIACCPPALAEDIRFRTITICNDFPSAYHTAAAHMNKDGRPDILVLGEPPGTVDWFENPGRMDAPWPRHPITGDQTRRNIDLAVEDVDRNGCFDVVVASDFEWANSDHDSLVSWFRQTAPGGAEWTGVRICSVPTAHRVRWMDVDGDKRNELVVVPVLGRGAKPPTYRQAAVPITCHWVPKDPVHEPWLTRVIDRDMTIVHGASSIDWNGDGKDDLLTASNQGIHLFLSEGEGRNVRWPKRQLAAGHQGEAPNQGSSEVEVGKSKPGRFLAAVEPWHGNEVVVYTPPAGGPDAPGLWKRQVLDDSFKSGHALVCVDLDGDGTDEIVAGYRGEGTSLYGYRLAPGPNGRWQRFAIDPGAIAAQGCTAADINGDGRMDIVAVGGSTHNVKLYLNETSPASRPTE
ncbi:MAG: VCBS repeat-containing protein [Phycisphaerae bacterium]|nr:VCBS repeat-containing protein [Phycisphaerae bacterium]